MSLINDALKKAQKQRTGDSPPLSTMPGLGGEPAVRIAKRAKPPAFNSLLIWIGAGAAGLLVLVVSGFFLVRWLMKSPETTSPARPAAVVAQTTPAPVASQPNAVPLVTISTSSSSPVLPVAPTPAPTPAPVTIVEPTPIYTAPVVPTPEPETPKPVVKMDTKAVAYIEALRVAGIRASTTDSKVLMNDRVYRIGDTVEHGFGLKLVVITSTALTFEDERGARYTRNF